MAAASSTSASAGPTPEPPCSCSSTTSTSGSSTPSPASSSGPSPSTPRGRTSPPAGHSDHPLETAALMGVRGDSYVLRDDMAEGEGFEPPVAQHHGCFQDSCHQP